MKSKVDISLVKNINRDLIYKYLLLHPNSTIPEISKVTGLSLPTVTRTINSSLEIGLISITDVRGDEKGRKAQCHSFNEDYCKSLLIHIKESRVFVRIVTLSGKTIFQQQSPISNENILQKLHNIIAAQFKDFTDIKNICVTFPGHISKGHVYASHAFPEFNGLNLKKILEDTYNVTACITDSVKVLVFSGDLYVPDYMNKMVLFLSFETEDGYGSAVSVNGVAFPGRTGSFGELYRLPINKQDKNLTDQQLYTALTQSMVAVVNPDAIVFYGDSSIDFNAIMDVISCKFFDYAIPEVYFGNTIIDDNFEAMKNIAFNCTLNSIYSADQGREIIQTWFN